jgi:hypothetical protein
MTRYKLENRNSVPCRGTDIAFRHYVYTVSDAPLQQHGSKQAGEREFQELNYQ